MSSSRKSIKINAILNIFKQCCNVIFPLVTYPYVSRTLGAGSIGKFSFADSIIQYFIIAATIGVPVYAIREGARIREDKEKIEQFASEVFSINVITMICSYLILVICAFTINRFSQEKALIIILSMNVIFNVLGRDWINSVYEDFVYITLRYIVFQIIALVLILLLVKKPEDYVIYTVIMMISNVGAQFLNFFHTQKYIRIRLCFKRQILKHIKPVLFLLCISIASVIYINSDITILGFMRAEDEVGVYYITAKIYTIIKTLMNALITVTIPRLSYYLGHNQFKEYNALLNKLRNALLILVIPCLVGLFFLSHGILLIVGSTEFISGECSLRILCIALLFSVFGCFYTQGILVANRQEKGFFVATVISAIVNIGLNFFFIPLWGINGAAMTTAISEILIVLISAVYAKHFHEKFSLSGWKSITLGAIFIAVICTVIHKARLSVLIETASSIVLSVVGYFSVLLICKNPLLLSFKDSFIGKLRGRK